MQGSRGGAHQPADQDESAGEIPTGLAAAAGFEVPCEKAPNPRHAAWKPMLLYKAGDVAKALAAQKEAMRQRAKAQRDAAKAARERARNVAAAIDDA